MGFPGKCDTRGFYEHCQAMGFMSNYAHAPTHPLKTQPPLRLNAFSLPVCTQVGKVLHDRVQVPLLNFTHRTTGMDCDIFIGRPDTTIRADFQRWGFNRALTALQKEMLFMLLHAHIIPSLESGVA